MRPGDSIRVEVLVTEVRPSGSKPDRGVVTMRHDTYNQDDDLILTADCAHILRRRNASAARG
jgi:acyl dehydratase